MALRTNRFCAWRGLRAHSLMPGVSQARLLGQPYTSRPVASDASLSTKMNGATLAQSWNTSSPACRR